MSGGLDRRHFVLASSAALAAAPLLTEPVAAQARALTTHRLNNVMIAVSDLDRSVAFYQKLFGTPVMMGDTAILRIGDGPHFLGMTQVKNGAQPGFLSYGLTVDNFDPARVTRALSAINAKTETSNRDGTPEVWTYDPDNIKIQLQHTSYGHGAGPWARCCRPRRRKASRPST